MKNYIVLILLLGILDQSSAQKAFDFQLWKAACQNVIDSTFCKKEQVAFWEEIEYLEQAIEVIEPVRLDSAYGKAMMLLPPGIKAEFKYYLQ